MEPSVRWNPRSGAGGFRCQASSVGGCAGGSAYAAMDEWALEKHCEKRSFEEVLEAVRSRKREIEFLKEVLEAGEVLEDSTLPTEVRSFLEAVLKSYPDLDIRVLAVARRREPTEEGHEELTKAMRDLL